MGCDSDGYEKAEYVGEDNIKEYIWTGGRAKKWRIRIRN